MTNETSGFGRKPGATWGQISTRWRIALGTAFALLGVVALLRSRLSDGYPNQHEFRLFFGVAWLAFAAFWFYRAVKADNIPFTSLLNPPQD